MQKSLKVLAGLVLASSIAGQAQTTSSSAKTTTTKKKHVPVRRATAPTKPSIESQIQALRENMAGQQSQIQALQQQLSQRDQQLQQVQQQAQAAVQQAQQQVQDANAAQQAVNTQNQTAVAGLQSAVGDLKTTNQSLTEKVVATRKAFDTPDAIHFKGITLSPTGSFIEFATVNRTKATASDIPTPFSAIPFDGASAAHLSEFYMTGRQSRIALTATGKLPSAQLTAYYEADWLGTGVTSNNNQSNSYVLRQRQIWGQAAFNSGFTITGGQMWTMATENAHAIDNKTEVLPATIDPNYQVGFVWARQPGIRLTYRFSPMATIGVSAEQAQTLSPSCAAAGTGAACPAVYLLGAVGTSSGLYNSAGAPGVGTSAPVTTYTYNLAPDLIAKVALDPKFAHLEAYGIARFFRDRLYPNVNPQTNRVINAALPASAGAYNDSTVAGAIGGSARIFADQKKYAFGVKGMWGEGTSRYGTTQLPDVTLRPDGQLAPLHNFSAMAFADLNPTSRLNVYAYYGTDYDFRSVFAQGAGQSGYGSHLLAASGCDLEAETGSTTAPTTGGTATGTVNGFSPASPANCSVQTKDVQEVTGGFWYDFYKGPMGRFREGFQYSFVERNPYSGVGNLAPAATDNVIETSMRYYLP